MDLRTHKIILAHEGVLYFYVPLMSKYGGIIPLGIAHHGDRLIRVGGGGRPTNAVDHVLDTTGRRRGEEDREQIVQAARR